ncbi:MAG TPA: LysM peptidoglycan-binding domain-containing protein [Patescibacteria group bacterium]|nr:LysM peptidoglycan-binding domain-containing protein [Patescibacteria group bacterium]
MPISVEDMGSVVRIAGVVPDAATAGTVRDTAIAAVPGTEIDARGITTPPPPMYQYVQPGDTLWTIAARAYGDPTKWRDIAMANPDVNPRRLVVGTRLLVPDAR